MENLEVSNERKNDDLLTKSYGYKDDDHKIEIDDFMGKMKEKEIQSERDKLIHQNKRDSRDKDDMVVVASPRKAKSDSDKDEDIPNFDQMEPRIDFDEETEEFKKFEHERIETDLGNIYDIPGKKDEIKGKLKQ